MNDLISVIIPVYNVEKYLKKCVDSVINQKYQNLEIILVDDGSPDNCPAICDEYKKKDKRIKVIHKANGGIASTRNRGLEMATGKYITFIDSDDFYDLDLFSDFCKFIENKEFDIYIFGHKKIYENQNYKFEKNAKIEKISNIECMKKILHSDLDDFLWNKIFKRTLFDGVRFPDGKNFEDLGATYKLVLKAKKIFITNSEYYGYYQRNNSITGNMSAKSIYDRIEIVKIRYNYIVDKFAELKNDAISDRIFQIFRYHIDCIKYTKSTELWNSKEMISEYEFYKKNYKQYTKKNLLSNLLYLNRHIFKILINIIQFLRTKRG